MVAIGRKQYTVVAKGYSFVAESPFADEYLTLKPSVAMTDNYEDAWHLESLDPALRLPAMSMLRQQGFDFPSLYAMDEFLEPACDPEMGTLVGHSIQIGDDNGHVHDVTDQYEVHQDGNVIYAKKKED